MKLKNILFAATTIFASLGTSAQTIFEEYGSPQNFSDVVLIYAGNSNRNTWNMTQLEPYVTHKYANGTESWFFDSFLFLEFVRSRSDNGTYTTFGFGNGMGGDKPATQQDWAWLLDEYFTPPSTYNSQKLAALDALIGEKAKTLGQPNFRHKVIIVCPAPKKDGSTWSTATWGTVNGKDISLATEANRLAAVKWYIDELVSRWKAANYKNIDLEGIYWIEESLFSNGGIIARVNDYARSKGLRTYWIPYYINDNESYCQKWHSTYKFDMCYYQPNYAFYQSGGTTLPISQLTTTCNAAKRYGAGLELEFETSGTSNALHSFDAAAHQRINDYMDVYTDLNVFKDAGVAYYVGSRGLNDMKASTDPVDHATIDRMASIVTDRLKARYGEITSVEGVPVDKVWAYAGDHRILTTTEASCHDISGRLIHQGVGLFECQPGIYILTDKHGNSVKLMVK